MKLLLLTLTFAFSFSALAQQQCVDIFATAAHDDAVSQTSGILREMDTDRYVVYRMHASQTVQDYLMDVFRIQEHQISALIHSSYPAVPERVVNHYRALLNIGQEANAREFREISEQYDLRHIKIESLIEAPESLIPLSDVVLRMTIRTNPTLAEFLAVVRFPNVIATETPVLQIVNRAVDHITPEMQSVLERTATRQMDFISQENGVTIWGEVKYLGRYKLYENAAGKDVSEKMINVKKLADMMPTPTKVLLVLTGPGRLTLEAQTIYDKAGIEVIYLTPDWY